MTLSELNRHREICERLKEDDEMIEKLRASYGLKSPTMNDMPHGSGTSDPVAVLAAEIADLEAKQKYLREEAKASEAEIRKFTNGIEDTITRLCFNLRFIGCMSWKEVADAIGGWNSPGSVKQLCYRYLKLNDETAEE